MSLVWRLYLLVALALLPAIVIQGWNERVLRQERELQARDEALRLTRLVAGEMEQVVENARTLLSALAVVSPGLPVDGAKCSAALSAMIAGRPQYAGIGIVDAQGRWLCAPVSTTAAEADLLSQPWFGAALATSGFAIAGVERDIIGEAPRLLFSQPLRTADGSAPTMLILGLDLGWLDEQFARRRLPDGSALTIADRQGRLLVRQPPPPSPGDPIAQRQLLGADGRATRAVVGPDGVERIVGYLPAAAAESAGFLVAVGVATGPLLAPLNHARQRGMLLIVLGAALALLAAWTAARLSVQQPMTALLDAAARWRAGDLAARAAVPSGRGQALDETAAPPQRRAGEQCASQAADVLGHDEQLRAEERQQESQDRLELALRAGNMGVWDVDLRTGHVFWDAAQHRICGTDPSRFLPTPPSVRELIHPDDRPAAEALAREAQANDRLDQRELRIVTPTGETRWLAIATTVSRDHQGQPIRISGVVRDVTAQRRIDADRTRALDEIARERGLFKALVDNLVEAIVAVFPHEGIVLRNAAWLPLHGFRSFDELPGISVESFAHLFEVSDAEGRVMGPGSWVLSRVMRGESFRDVEVKLRRTDIPHERWVSYNGAALTNDAGDITLALLTIRDITERKRFEERLRERDAMLALAEDAARIGAWEVDLASGLVRATAAFFRLYGLEPAAGAVPHERIRAQRHPEDRPRVTADFQAAVASGQDTFEAEYRVARGDGWCWVLGRGRVVRDGLGRPIRYAGIDMDITERRQSEEQLGRLLRELDAERARLAAILESNPAGILMAEAPSGRIVYGNRRIEEILAHPVLTSASVADYFDWVGFHPDGRRVAATEWPLARALAGETVRGDEFLYQRGDGRRAWIRVSAAPVRDAAGSIVASAVALYDIDTERRAESALRESEERLRLALEAGHFGVFEVDFAAGKVIWDETERGLFGIDAERLPREPRDFVQFVHPDDRAGFDGAVGAALATGGDYRCEFRIATGDARTVWLAERGHITLGADGRPQRMSGVNWDITDRRLAEERQRLLVRELDHRVKNLLAVIQSIVQQSSQHATSPAALRDSLVGRLGAMAVAHEILSATRWVGAGLLPVIQGTLAAHVGEGGSRLRLAVDDLLLDPSTAQNLSLALHELATNAVKYGAWSTAEGSVELSGGARDGMLSLIWRERGGPAVSPPTRKGFGSVLLSRALAYQTGGKVELEWNPPGLICRITLPLQRAQPRPTADLP